MKRSSPRLLHETLLMSAERFPERTAIVSDEERITYADLVTTARRFAHTLRDRGVRRADRVAVFLENGVPAAVGVYGALLCGATFIVVNPQTKPDKLRYILDDAGVSALLTDARSASTAVAAAAEIATLATVVVVGPTDIDSPLIVPFDDAIRGPDHPVPEQVIPLDLAALVYTSGSTGQPKGVMLSHQNMVFTLGSLVEYLRLDSDDRILNALPLAFDYGLYQLLMAVSLGATLVLETSFSFPTRIVQRAQSEEVTVLPGVPTMFATLLSMHRERPLSMPSIRRITNTAAHLPDEYVPRLLEISPRALIFRMYGLTECKRVCYLEPELVSTKPRSVGKAIPGTEAYVLDESGEPVAPGATGTLFVRGPHVMVGYWNLPEATAHMLKPGRYPGERVLCTHDFFTVDDDGFLYFVGRSDDIIKSRGEKVSPVEVENVLATIPGVREAAVVGVDDEILGQAVQAFVVLDVGVVMDERAFRRACMARMESYMVPKVVTFVDDLPKTATGKVRRKSLLAGETSDDSVSTGSVG